MAVSAAELAAIQTDTAKWTCDKTCSIYRDAGAATPANADVYGTSTSSPSDTSNYTLVATTTCGVGQPTRSEQG